jgi:hypothetical protein
MSRWKIQFDPFTAAISQKQTAARVKTSLCVGGEMTVLPEHVGAGNRGVAAEIHFDRWRKPAEMETIFLRHQEGRFRKIHFSRYPAHPLLGWAGRQDANGGGIPRKRPIGESIYLYNTHRHDLAG